VAATTGCRLVAVVRGASGEFVATIEAANAGLESWAQIFAYYAPEQAQQEDTRAGCGLKSFDFQPKPLRI
jgi:hypothetical protein